VVADDGCGIDAATLPHIFNPYFTTKAAGKGTGLGLSTVLAIVEDHGGSIGVQSEPGRGTTFTTHLPCHDLPEEVPASAPRTLCTGSERILFVDDEGTLVDIAEQMLTQLGYQVDTTTCPLQALAAFKKHPQRYQLVITDMTMPGMTGVSLAESILSIRPRLPVLICSGFVNVIGPAQAMRIGIRGLIKKPFTIDHLSLKVREALGSGHSGDHGAPHPGGRSVR
jgi:CheY-like chemotaxis protein